MCLLSKSRQQNVKYIEMEERLDVEKEERK